MVWFSEASRFLSGKTAPARPRVNGPNAPTGAALTQAAGTTSFPSGAAFWYYVTSQNVIGESQGFTGTVSGTASAITTSAAGQTITVTITPSGSGNAPAFFNVYRSNPGGSLASARFIGRVANSGASTTAFTDLGNSLPGSVTGLLIQGDTMQLGELSSLFTAQTGRKQSQPSGGTFPVRSFGCIGTPQGRNS